MLHWGPMPQSRLRFVLATCLYVAVAGTALLLPRLAHAQGRSSGLVGKLAPEFHIQGIYNESYSLEKFKGHILVLQFGSSW